MRPPSRADHRLCLTSNNRLHEIYVVRWLVLEVRILNNYQIIIRRVRLEHRIEPRRQRRPLTSIHIMAVQRNVAAFRLKLANERINHNVTWLDRMIINDDESSLPSSREARIEDSSNAPFNGVRFIVKRNDHVQGRHWIAESYFKA